jgi:hypothetical protein
VLHIHWMVFNSCPVRPPVFAASFANDSPALLKTSTALPAALVAFSLAEAAACWVEVEAYRRGGARSNCWRETRRTEERMVVLSWCAGVGGKGKGWVGWREVRYAG